MLRNNHLLFPKEAVHNLLPHAAFDKNLCGNAHMVAVD